ncbi:hypothetical protein MHO82_00855 [Vibrio sp. Of7-15]|uniref:hypothetical protein n=1 Tax=Vibrio sp. Of7-15 TaxID=2724879 RepID=UPI001EF2F865|nr:hypothetical protein [Vibrio sp. Of7-15]MCG7495408.1 hypothetical protein [Vibrio sp. Of7-15]
MPKQNTNKVSPESKTRPAGKVRTAGFKPQWGESSSNPTKRGPQTKNRVGTSQVKSTSSTKSSAAKSQGGSKVKAPPVQDLPPEKEPKYECNVQVLCSMSELPQLQVGSWILSDPEKKSKAVTTWEKSCDEEGYILYTAKCLEESLTELRYELFPKVGNTENFQSIKPQLIGSKKVNAKFIPVKLAVQVDNKLGWAKTGYFYHFIDGKLSREYKIIGGDNWNFQATLSTSECLDLDDRLLSEQHCLSILLPLEVEGNPLPRQHILYQPDKITSELLSKISEDKGMDWLDTEASLIDTNELTNARERELISRKGEGGDDSPLKELCIKDAYPYGDTYEKQYARDLMVGVGNITYSKNIPEKVPVINISNVTEKLIGNNTEQRIDENKSIKGRVKKLLYTHNTSLNGMLGILSSRMIGSVERSVNFRYGMDSRYAGGITFVMKDNFETSYKDIREHDLYKQNRIFLSDKKPDDAMTPELFKYVESISDFRCCQLKNIVGHNGKLRPIYKKSSGKKIKIFENEKLNSRLSLVNPQVRVEWSKNKITKESIDIIIITRFLHEKISESKEFKLEVADAFQAYSKRISSLKGDAIEKKVREEVIKSLNSFKAIQEYKRFYKSGRVKVIEIDHDNIYSHRAGRIGKRGRAGELEMEKAAEIALEIHDNYFEEKMNNSPAALNMDALTKFEQEYFKHLLHLGKISP